MDINRKVKESAKKCPFCGKKPRLRWDPTRDVYRLGCVSSICSMRPQVPFLIDKEADGDLRTALALWNQRTN